MRTDSERSSAAGSAFLDRRHGRYLGLPQVILVGRANVGKSTLFNRIASRARAITSSIPGTTRDLNFARASHEGREFAIVDSGGLELAPDQALSAAVIREALAAAGSAEVVVLVLDGRAGLGSADAEAIGALRRIGSPLIMAVNKIDHPAREKEAGEFYALGAEKLFLISAAHGRGIGELLDEIVARLPEPAPADQPAADLRVALIGRPNVGKSSLLNRLCGFQRAIVDQRPGTTRDPVDIRLSSEGRGVMLVDTAGVRRPPRVAGELERHSVGRAISAIRRADVVLLVIDAVEGVTAQDARLARLADSSDRALVLVVNKWDLVVGRRNAAGAFTRAIRRRHPFLASAATVFTSALTGDGVDEALPAALKAGDAWRAIFKTSQLNQILGEALRAMDPPIVGGRRLRLRYVTQIGSAPPRLCFFTNVDREIPPNYVRFLEARFRRVLPVTGSPLRIEFRRARQASPGVRRARARVPSANRR